LPEIVVDPRRCMACRSCEMACAINRDSVARTLAGAIREEITPTPRVTVQGNERISMPVQCRHCEEAPCLDTCPSGALYRHADGRVLFSDNKCIGCWMCVASCAFGAIKPSAAGKVAIKCDACFGMERPFCVEACPTGALAYLETADLRKVAKRKAGDIVETLFQEAGAPGAPAFVKLSYSPRGGE
jgi:anaerobic carbon-monoxide dehydrogenase iron sulfur subunit